MHTTRRRFLTGLVASPVMAPWRIAANDEASQAAPVLGTSAGHPWSVDDVPLRWCPPGRFRMGSPTSEAGRRPDETQVDVTLTRGFWMGRFEVTQAQWHRVVGAFPGRTPSAAFGEGDDHPAYWITFDQAETFCRALTIRSHDNGTLPASQVVSLPTEAQWEYACRAGTTTASAFGPALAVSQANFDPEADRRRTRLAGGARPVGSYAANAWGLNDMHGNVWEWCRDYYHARLPGGTDPDLSTRPGVRNGDGSFSRVRRGGAWIEAEWACRSACRLRYEPYRSSDHIGFRIVVVETR